MAKVTEQDRRDLSKALSYANWSVLGLFIPLIGWFLGGMALSIIKTIPEVSSTKSKIHQIKTAAWGGIIISCLAVGAWSGYYIYQNNQNEKARTAQEQSIKKKQDDLRNKELRAKNGLNNCLDEAYKSYNEGFLAESRSLGRSDGKLPNENRQIWDNRYQDYKNECYRKKDAGVFDDYYDKALSPYPNG